MATILLVDDEPVLLELFARDLVDAGYRALTAGSAETALGLLDELLGDADLVIADIRLPSMHGCALGRAIVRRWPHIRLLFISGYVMADLIRRGECPQNIPTLAKPFTPDLLKARIADTLARPPWAPPEEG